MQNLRYHVGRTKQRSQHSFSIVQIGVGQHTCTCSHVSARTNTHRLKHRLPQQEGVVQPPHVSHQRAGLSQLEVQSRGAGARQVAFNTK